MLTLTRTPRLAKAMVTTAALAAVAATLVPGAGADPKQYDALATMGSDTTQDIMNALAGHSNGINYSPLQSSAASGQRQLISFNALAPAGGTDNCIIPKVGGAAIYRPNGSTEGRRALSRAIDGAGYGPADQCGGTKPVAGLVDFARSSSGPSGSGTALTYAVFARDALSFAYYRAAGSPVTALTRAQLTNLFTNGPQTINGVNIIPCGIQRGSGTFKSWNGTVGVTDAQEEVAVDTCQAIVTATDDEEGRIQEHSGAQLVDKGNVAPAGSQVIVGFSSSNFIAQCNGTGLYRLGPTPGTVTGANLGDISNNGSGTALGVPYSGTCASGTTAPVASFYTDATFGRDVYNVFATAKIDSGFGFNDIKTMFKNLSGNPANICEGANQTTVRAHGYLTPANCGDTSLKGPLVSGIQ